MNCFYINLSTAKNRKLWIEENFLKYNLHNWSLIRFNAFDKNSNYINTIKGRSSNAEKACYLSHKEIIANNLGATHPYLIFEDDTYFNEVTFTVLNNFLLKDINWDIIYTDIGISNPRNMIDMIYRKKCLTGSYELHEIGKMKFFGANSYVINHNSSQKILQMIDCEINIPYDLILRELINEGKLKAFYIFPFITTENELGNKSQIQSDYYKSTELALKTFRRMIFGMYDKYEINESIDFIEKELLDDNLINFSKIIAATLSDKFIKK